MSKYTAEQVREAVKDFAGYSYTHQGIGGELMAIAEDYAALLRERESVKAAVTDETVETACKAASLHSDDAIFPDDYGDGEADDVRNYIRAALEAVAPMLASARVPTGLRERINHAWHDHDEDGRVSISMGDARILVEQVLAAATKPEAED